MSSSLPAEPHGSGPAQPEGSLPAQARGSLPAQPPGRSGPAQPEGRSGHGLQIPRLDALVPAALDAVDEAAWLTVVYLGVECFWAGGPAWHGPLLLTTTVLAVFAAAGLVLARGLAASSEGRVEAGRQTVPTVAFAVVGGMAGWLVAPEARDFLLAGNLPAALAIHPGGWLAGVAILRGAAHPSRAHDEAVMESVLRWGMPVVALPWLVAAVAPSSLRSPFVGPGFSATLTFAAFGLLALAFARLDSLGGGAGFDWRSNRSWLVVLVSLLVGLLCIALPAAFLLGVPVTLALAGILGPVAFVGAAVISLLAVPAGLLAGALASILELLHGPASQATLPPITSRPPPAPAGPPGGELYGVFVALVVAILGVVAAIVISRWLLGALGTRRPLDTFEERATVVPAGAVRVARPAPHIHLPRRQRTPADALAAYLAALRVLASDPLARRDAHETPAEHARRLRSTGVRIVPLDLLAADYQLLRYGVRRLSRTEHRRAVERWRRIRDGARRP